MRQIHIEARRDGDWKKKFLGEDHYTEVVNESCEVIGPAGDRRFLLLKGALSQEKLNLAYSQIRDWKPVSDNRGNSTGSERYQRVRKDGSISKTNEADPANSGILGFYDRYPRFPFCRKCAWNQQNPSKFDLMNPLFAEVSEIFRTNWAEKWAIQAEQVSKTHPDFVIPNTVYTTVTYNRNYRTACHLDPKNLKGSVSSMAVIHDGPLRGGELILPEYGLAFQLGTGDLVFFDGTQEWHGNGPIYQLSKNATRVSLVFYYREKMIDCGSHAEELERAKNRKLGERLNDS